eukprot:3061179-Karenia_brevis.AAC.1
MLRTCTQRTRQTPHHIAKLHGPRKEGTSATSQARRLILKIVGSPASEGRLPNLRKTQARTLVASISLR